VLPGSCESAALARAGCTRDNAAARAGRFEQESTTMCGRYAAFLPAEAIVALFQTVGPVPNWAPTWNMAPTRDGPVVRLHPETHERRIDLLRWGLIPHWAKDPKSVRMTINARGETAATTPMFRDAFARRRCLIPADAFYEWQVTPDDKAAPKQPWAIARADGQPIVFAGLWEGWRGADGTVIRSYTILTTSANEALRPLHERMPVVLEPPDWPVWLGEAAGDFAALVRPSPAAFHTWRVRPTVNSVRNDGPELLEVA
jgi:putative SOS response-associated peptidase YedK